MIFKMRECVFRLAALETLGSFENININTKRQLLPEMRVNLVTVVLVAKGAVNLEELPKNSNLF